VSLTDVDHDADQPAPERRAGQGREKQGRESQGLVQRIGILLNHPLSTYYLLLGTTLLLLTLGLIMVLSASSIDSYRVFGNAYTLAERQALFAAMGLVAMFIVARTSIPFWRGISWPFLGVACTFLVIVLVIGVSVAGQRNWIDFFGPFRFQPSELAKLSLVVWGATTLTRRDRPLDSWRNLLTPLLPVAGGMLILVLLEGDFGNSLMLAAIALGLLFAVGAPLRVFAAIGAVMSLGILLLTAAAPYRMARITRSLHPAQSQLGAGWQVAQGQLALGSGGWWGVGLGASREKWGSLPEAHTDFIFPVIGEELGLLGTISVLALFAVLSFAIFRMVRNTDDMFVRLATAGVGCWIVVQAILNLGAVLGLLPITGVPLPLVSYGGSSLVPTLVALGMLMAFARQEPGARQALRRRSTAQALRKR